MGSSGTLKDDETAFRMRLGARLREARRRNSKSLQEVADYFGLSKATVGHWETGTNPPDIGKLFRLARYYGTSVGSLVSEPLSRKEAAAQLAQMILNDTKPSESPQEVADQAHRFGTDPGDSHLGGLDHLAEQQQGKKKHGR